MTKNNKRSFLLHIILLFIGIISLLNSSSILSWVMNEIGYSIFFVSINLIYFGFGYKYGTDLGKSLRNLISFSLIGLIGIIVWCICLIIYIGSSDNSSFLGPEVIWLLNAGYNFPSFYLYRLISIDSLNGIFPVTLLFLNFYQSIMIWLGLQTRIIILKVKSE